jgi:phosphoadenosine phosphosulfate reductase
VAVTTAPDLEHLSAQEVLAYVVEHHHPRAALACSFQKEETVLLDMLLEQEPRARVFAIDTGVLFPSGH